MPDPRIPLPTPEDRAIDLEDDYRQAEEASAFLARQMEKGTTQKVVILAQYRHGLDTIPALVRLLQEARTEIAAFREDFDCTIEGHRPHCGGCCVEEQLRIYNERDETRAERDRFREAAWSLSTYAASIRWNPRECNTPEWLEGLRRKIEEVQAIARSPLHLARRLTP